MRMLPAALDYFEGRTVQEALRNRKLMLKQTRSFDQLFNHHSGVLNAVAGTVFTL